jgi:hypothetical protein
MAKSAIFFSKNCDDDVKQIVKNVTGIQNEALGLVRFVGFNPVRIINV